MKKTKKELSDLELTAMLIQYLVEIDEFQILGKISRRQKNDSG